MLNDYGEVQYMNLNLTCGLYLLIPVFPSSHAELGVEPSPAFSLRHLALPLPWAIREAQPTRLQ